MLTKVLFFIGSRANISSASPILQRMNVDPEIEVKVILSNSAVLDKYGEVEHQLNFLPAAAIRRVNNIIMGDVPSTMSKTFGLTAVDCAGLFEIEEPDWVFIIGDRYEMLAATSAAALMNIRVAHSMGGEITGTIDESIRHAITKLSHLHFAANEDAKQRIIKLGEDPAYVLNSGCPRVDFVSKVLNDKKFTAQEILNAHDGVGARIDSEKFVLVSQHAVTTEYHKQRKHINETLLALSKIEFPIVMLWPNVDSGSDIISREIRKQREAGGLVNFHFISNLPAEEYTILLNECACLVGNSSSGIREAAYLGTPVVNVGSRQNARLRGVNVIDVDNDCQKILRAIKHQINHGKYERDTIYGDGNASVQICEQLKKQRPSLQKTIYE